MIKTCMRSIGPLILGVTILAASVSAADPVDPCFRDLPPGCFVNRSIELPKEKVAAIGNRLGAAVKRISNTYMTVQGKAIQVNIVEGETEADAVAIHKVISRMKSDPVFCIRTGQRVVEYVGNDPALAIKTSYELGFKTKPKQVRYRVIAEVATVDKADYMASNELFNLFLTSQPSVLELKTPSRIAELSNRFVFGDSLTLRKPGDPPRADYEFMPEPREKTASVAPGIVTYAFDEPETAYGVPNVTLTAIVSVDDGGLTPTARKADKALCAATAWWPADDPKIKALAKEITSKASSTEEKVQALLTWLAPGTNIKFGGPVVGSRWGVEKVLQQRYGQCWDFADCFVTFCRAIDIPCREVAGWLYGTSGHVWAEVLIEGKGWQQVDATGGGRLNCGIYHIPYFTTEDGEMPILYVSMPKIDVLEIK